MSRRQNTGNREQLTPTQLEELRLRLALMTSPELEIFYKSVHNACRYEIQGRVASPRLIQELVTAWKVMRTRASRT